MGIRYQEHGRNFVFSISEIGWFEQKARLENTMVFNDVYYMTCRMIRSLFNEKKILSLTFWVQILAIIEVPKSLKIAYTSENEFWVYFWK